MGELLWVVKLIGAESWSGDLSSLTIKKKTVPCRRALMNPGPSRRFQGVVRVSDAGKPTLQDPEVPQL